MTWAGWVNSEYNTIGLYVNTDNTIWSRKTGGYLCEADDVDRMPIKYTQAIYSKPYILYKP